MRRVIIESPYSGKTPEELSRNIVYARRCLVDAIHRGEAPLASHLLYTQPGVLDDDVASERNMGIFAGLTWTRVADTVVAYVDLGVSEGMTRGLDHARRVFMAGDFDYRTLVSHRGACGVMTRPGTPCDCGRIDDLLSGSAIQDERTLIRQLVADLYQAHTEIMTLQGLAETEAEHRDWPEWSSPANTIRDAEKLLGHRLARTNAWTHFPD